MSEPIHSEVVLDLFLRQPSHFGRFMRRIERDGDCWLWQGPPDGVGYGVINIGKNTIRRVHRIAYELFNGPIPEGLVIDHLCRNRLCVNPRHLEAVTNRENLLRGEGASAKNARKTHCHRGHPFSEENTYLTCQGRRLCRICERGRQQRYEERRRAA